MNHLRTAFIACCLALLAGILIFVAIRSTDLHANVAEVDQLAVNHQEAATVDAGDALVVDPSAADDATSQVELDPEPVAQASTMEFGERGPITFKVTSKGEKHDVNIHLGGFTITETPDGWFPDFEGSQGRMHGTESGPDLPRIVRFFQGREGFTPRAVINESEFVEVNNVDVAPQRSMHRDENEDWYEGREPSPIIYNQDAFWPQDIVEIQEVKSRDKHIVRVEYRPVQYNPVTKTIRQHKLIDSSIDWVKNEDRQAFKFVSSATEVTDDCDCSERETRELDLFPPVTGAPADFASRWPGEESGACVKIRIDSQGIWRLRQADLIARGVSASDLVGSQIRMYTRDREIPIYVSTQGSFSSSDFIEFYGEGFRGFHSEQNAYFLGFGGPGVPARFANNQESVQTTIAGAPTAQSSCRQITFDPLNDWAPNLNVREVANAPPYHLEFDGYVASEILSADLASATRPGAITHAFAGTGNAATPANPRMTVAVAGSVVRAHELEVRNTSTGVNNSATPLEFFGGDTVYTQVSRALPENILSPSTSNLRFGTSVSGFDRFFLDWAKLQYDRRLVASANQLAFGGKTGSYNYNVSNFSAGARPYILDITDPTNPLQLTATTSGNRVRFGRNLSYDACYYAAGTAAIKTVPSANISQVAIRNLADPRRQADYILVVPEKFNTAASAYDLLAYRAEQLYTDENNDRRRLNVLVASAESIYNEFGYGIESVDAIRQFLGYAYHHFQKPSPRFVVLAGDSTRNPLQKGGNYPWEDHLPTKFSGTSFIYTTIDQYLGAVNGDDSCPDIAIGRLPVNSVGEFQTVIAKMKAYEANSAASSGFRRNVLLVADRAENPDCTQAGYAAGSCYDYNYINEEIRTSVLGSSFNTTTAYKNQPDTTVTIENKIRNAFNNGSFFINYFGHGSAHQWGIERNQQFMGPDIVNGLLNNNSRLPLVSIYTCSYGRFAEPELEFDGVPTDCGAEQLLLRSNGGAGGVIAPSGLSQTQVTLVMGLQYYNSMVRRQVITDVKAGQFVSEPNVTTVPAANIARIGDCILEGFTAVALQVSYDAAELKFIEHFLDPAMHHNRSGRPLIDPP